MLCKKLWIIPLPGTCKRKRLKENAGAAEVKIALAEVDVLDGALAQIEMSEVLADRK